MSTLVNHVYCANVMHEFIFFFFSSRRRHTRLQGDWSSDVCSSDLPKDAADKYRRARDVLDGWLGEGVWRRDERPAIYPYDQTFSVAGQSVTRTGFVALGQVTDYARGVVLPHERTHAGPKRDRMELLEATGADTGLLFMLASDPDGELRRATAPVGEPIAEARDLKGRRPRLL